MPQSAYTRVFHSRGMRVWDEENEVTTWLKDVAQLPAQPVYDVIFEDKTPLATMALDETGKLWIGEGVIDFEDMPFENYEEFRKRISRSRNN